MKRIMHLGVTVCVALAGFTAAAQAETAYEYADRKGVCDDRGGLASAEFIDTTDDAGNPAKRLEFRCNGGGAIDPTAVAGIGAAVLLLGVGLGGGDGGGSSSGTPGTGPSGTTGSN